MGEARSGCGAGGGDAQRTLSEIKLSHKDSDFHDLGHQSLHTYYRCMYVALEGQGVWLL